MTTEEWVLTDQQRAETANNIRANLSNMAFFRGEPIPSDVAEATAAAIEKKAYTVARVEARTTTGMRPHHETLKAYVRKLGSLVLESVQGTGDLVVSTNASAPHAGEHLDLTGSREFLTKESAEEVLAPMLAPGAKITKIKFSTKSFGTDAAEVACRAIENVAHHLLEADMSDIIAGRPEDEALAALRIISSGLAKAKLRHLDLSDNALGEKGIRACAAAFAEQEQLESIAFQNVGCSVHGCVAVDELIVKTSSLKRIHLYNNMSGSEGAEAIARLLTRCPSIQDFKMVSSRVGAEGGIALAKALTAGTELIRLDLHDNPMTHEFVEDLVQVIHKQPSLKYLNLNDTGLTDEGVATVAEALAQSAPNLEELDLELNEITVDGAEALATALQNKTKLKKLNLKENELEDDGALAIAKGIAALPNLEIVDVCTNQIKRGGALAIAKACTNLPNLKALELNDNEISDAGVEALKSILKGCGKLEVLGSLEDNMPDEDDEDHSEDEGHESVDADVDSLAAELAREHI